MQQQGKMEIQQRPGQVSQRVTIGSLPENVLLEIFDSYRALLSEPEWGLGELAWTLIWHKLVHVCQRWRHVIFASPIRLNLQLFFTGNSRLLDHWPPLPLVMLWSQWYGPFGTQRVDNFIAGLEHRDRVRKITIACAEDFLWEKIATAMEGPYPALRSLSFASFSDSDILFPDTFMNASAPCLQDLSLTSISFPSLPRLLLSTSDLTSLRVSNIPNSGYISPEEMAKCPSALPKLGSLEIYFKFPTLPPHRRNGPVTPTRVVLPALTRLCITCESEYLEVLASQIDAPLLDYVATCFLTHPIFDIPQTSRLFGHLDSFVQSTVTLKFDLDCVPEISYLTFHSSKDLRHSLRPWSIRCRRLDWQVIFVAQICSQILPFRSSVKSLNIDFSGHFGLMPGDEVDPTTWIQLFRSFTSVQSLSIPASLVPSIGAALQSLTGGSAADSEVFPSLHSLSIEGVISNEAGQQGIESFVAARQHNGRPIAVTRTCSRDDVIKSA